MVREIKQVNNLSTLSQDMPIYGHWVSIFGQFEFFFEKMRQCLCILNLQLEFNLVENSLSYLQNTFPDASLFDADLLLMVIKCPQKEIYG